MSCYPFPTSRTSIRDWAVSLCLHFADLVVYCVWPPENSALVRERVNCFWCVRLCINFFCFVLCSPCYRTQSLFGRVDVGRCSRRRRWGHSWRRRAATTALVSITSPATTGQHGVLRQQQVNTIYTTSSSSVVSKITPIISFPKLNFFPFQLSIMRVYQSSYNLPGLRLCGFRLTITCRKIPPSIIQLRRLTTSMTDRDDYDDKAVRGGWR